MEEKYLLKDRLFNETQINRLAEQIQSVYSEFDKKNFLKKVLEKFPELELTPRIKWISDNLKVFLPQDYQKAVSILLKSLPPHLDTDNLDSDFGDFIYAPYSDFVAKYGCSKENLLFSLAALKEMTTRFSAEDAIRYFINAFPKETMQVLQKWSKDSDYHVRRLTSEGTRPRLPWSQRIKTSPKEAIHILDNLYSDKSRFVTRSVANHLNDISKIDSDLMFNILKKWQKTNKQTPKELDYIINQSLRTLIKLGNKDAITFMNFTLDPKVAISNLVIKKDPVIIGENVEFSFTLTAKENERLLIDYIIYFQNKAGNGQNKKVFKLKIIDLKKNQKLIITKKHKMRHFSTRKLNQGIHKVGIQINGIILAEKTFMLRD